MKNPLPYLVAFLTQHNRQIVQEGVNFEWSATSWSYNFFRFLELLFGRKYGIRPEMSASTDGVVEFYTLEAAFSFFESKLRSWKMPSLVKVYVPVFAGAPIRVGSPYLFAIAFDAKGASTAGVDTGKTLSFTASGSDNLIITHCAKLTAGTTGVTWNGSAFTQINTTQTSPAGDKLNTWAFVGANGTQNIVSSGTSTYNAFVATSYSGVNQSTTPDSSNASSNAPASPQTISTTVVASNCWTFLSIFSDNAAPAASTGSFLRQVGADIFITAFDSNGTVSTGSVSMATTYSPNTGVAQIICSFAPSAAAYTAKPDLRSYFC